MRVLLGNDSMQVFLSSLKIYHAILFRLVEFLLVTSRPHGSSLYMLFVIFPFVMKILSLSLTLANGLLCVSHCVPPGIDPPLHSALPGLV